MATHASASAPVQRETFKWNYYLCLICICVTLISSSTATGPGPRGTPNIPKCASFCSESSKFPIYETGTTYTYDYSADVATFVEHGSSGASRVHLRAKAELTPTSACDFRLKLRSVSLEESEPDNSAIRSRIPNSEALVSELERTPLHFSYQNGKIESVCVVAAAEEEEESVWVLNVKRGMLSMLQNSMTTTADKGQSDAMETVQEVDVNGKCPTIYTRNGVTVKRVKNLGACAQRASQLSGLQSIPYTSSSPIQSLPLLSGTQTCEQTIDGNGKPTKVQCMEEHNFQPFDYVRSGARTEVVQKLNLIGEQITQNQNDQETSGSIIRRTGLLFEIDETTSSDSSSSNSNAVDEILQRMEELEDGNENSTRIRSTAPERFMELISQLRGLDSAALKALHGKTTKIGRTFLLDALPFVGTPNSLTFMVDLWLESKLSSEHKDSWLTSLAFIKRPSLRMIDVLQPLLTNNKERAVDSRALFGISAMVHSYCTQTQTENDCSTGNMNPIIAKTMQAIYSMIRTNGCDLQGAGVNSPPFLRAIYALKAIGNAGLPDSDNDGPQAQSAIEKCYRLHSNPIEIRLAAVDAFRRWNCGTYKQDSLLHLLSNRDENTEVRIQAYLAVMRCPKSESIQVVKEVLEKDAVNQVVSFMWTHLTNLRESSSPAKQSIRDLLSNEALRHKLSSPDARKFSRNYEGTKYWEQYNVGGGYDANLIFSPESFLPRSAMVNISAHLFGESVNLLEFGVRAHALEQLLEPIFGPAGYFPDQTVNQALHSMRVRRSAGKSSRSERLKSIYNEIGELATEQQQQQQPGASFYTRVFGNEIASKSFVIAHRGRTVPMAVDEAGENWLDLTHWLDNMSKGKSLEYTRSNMLADLSYAVPTGAGLPLTLQLQAASTISVNASGKVDMHKYWDQKQMEVVGRLAPSASLQIVGMMAVGIGSPGRSGARSGLRIENILHSSSAIEGNVMMRHGKLVHASLGLPQAKQELFTAKSAVYLVRASGAKVAEKVSPLIPRLAHSICTPRTIERVLGFRVCAEVDAPSTGSWLQAPASASLHIERTDTHRSYDFSYRWELEGHGTANRTDIEVTFDTPGSRVNRRLSAKYVHDVPEGILRVALETPAGAVDIDGEYGGSSSNGSHLQFTTRSGSSRLLHVNAELRRPTPHRIEPRFVMLWHERPLIELDGSAVGLERYFQGTAEDAKATFDLNLKHVVKESVNLNGALSRRNGDEFEHTLSISSGAAFSGRVKAGVKLNEEELACKMEMNWVMNGGPNKGYSVNGKVQRTRGLRDGVGIKYTANADLVQHPMATTTTATAPAAPGVGVTLYTFTGELATGPAYCETLLKIGSDTSAAAGGRSWTFKSVYNNQISQNRGRKAQRLELVLQGPAPELEYSILLAHRSNTSGFSTQCGMKLGSDRDAQAHLAYGEGRGWKVKRNLAAGVKVSNWFDYGLKAAVDEVKRKEYEASVALTMGTVEWKAGANYKDRSSNARVDHSFEFRAQGDNANWPTMSGSAMVIASEKLAQVGGQIDAGDKRKWSGNLMWSAPKRNTRKMEAKMSHNAKKWHGTLNWKRSRNGDRTLVLDSTGYGRRFFAEAQLTTGSTLHVSVYPNKNRAPEYKASWQSSFGRRSATIRLDYFGELAEFAGNYEKERGLGSVEVQWGGVRELLLSFDVPRLGFTDTSLVVNLEAPSWLHLDNLGVSLQHSLSMAHIGTQFTATLNGDRSSLSVNGGWDFASRESESQLSIRAESEVDGVRSQWTTQVHVLRTELQLVFDFSNQFGEGEAVPLRLRLEHTRRYQGGLTCKLELDGLTSLLVPKTSVTFSSQGPPYFVGDTELDVNWVSLEDGEMKRVNLQLGDGGGVPWNYVLAVQTQWKPLDNLEIVLKTEFPDEDSFLSVLSVRGGGAWLPIDVTLRSMLNGGGGSWLVDSLHEGSISWKNPSTGRPMKLKGEGRIKFGGEEGPWKDARLKALVDIDGHPYKLELRSHKVKHMQQLEATLVYDGQKSEAGFGWQCERRGNLVKVTAWREGHARPRISFDYRHLNEENYFVLEGQLQEEGRGNLGQIVTEFHYTGLEHWEVTAKLDADAFNLPQISFNSNHAIEDGNEVRHSTEFVLTPREDSPNGGGGAFWGMNLDDTRVLLKFNLRQGRELSGSVHVNEKEVRLVGLLESEGGGGSEEEEEDGHHAQKIDLEISSHLFQSVHTSAEYRVDSNSLHVAFNGARNGSTFFGFNLGGKNHVRESKLDGKLSLICPFGHKVEGAVVVDVGAREIRLELAETEKKAFGFAVAASAQPENGHMTMILNSKVVETMRDVELKAEYKLDVKNGHLVLEGHYKRGGEVKSKRAAHASAIWRQGLRKALLRVQTDDAVILEFISELKGARLTSRIEQNGRRLASFDGEYTVATPSREWSQGEHRLQLVYTDTQGKGHTVTGTTRLDIPNRVQMNLQTPVEGWRDWTADARLAREKPKHKFNVALSLVNNKEIGEVYNVTAELHTGHSVRFGLLSPVEGWRSLEANAIWRQDSANHIIEFSGAWDGQKITFSSHVDQTSASLKLQTPFVLLENVDGSLQWNLDGPALKSLQVYMKLNGGAAHQCNASWQLDMMKGHANILVNSPLLGGSTTSSSSVSPYTARVKYNFLEEAAVEAVWQLGASRPPQALSAKLDLSKEQAIELVVVTPWGGYRLMTFGVEWDGTGQEYSGTARWNISGQPQQASAHLSLKEPGKVELLLQTPLKSWSELKATLFYRSEKGRRTMEVHLVGPGGRRLLELKNELVHSGDLTFWNNAQDKKAKISVAVNMQSVLLPPGFERLDLATEYTRRHTGTRTTQTLTLQARKEDHQLIDTKLNLEVETGQDNFSLNLNGEFTAPALHITTTAVNGTYGAGVADRNLQVSWKQQGAAAHALRASHSWTATHYKAELETPLRGLQHAALDLHAEQDGRVGGSLELNKKRIEMDGRLLCAARLADCKVTFEFKTPFSGYTAAHVQLSSRIVDDSLLIDYVLQNDQVRWMGKVEGAESGRFLRVQLSNPVRGFEQLLCALQYNSSGVYARLERNGANELAASFSYPFGGGDEQQGLEISIKSRLPEFHFDGHARAVSWGAGEFEIKTLNSKWNHALIKWEVAPGHAKLEWQPPAALNGIGNSGATKTVRVGWKLDAPSSDLRLEGWVASPSEYKHEKGFSLQYSLSGGGGGLDGNGKFGGRVTYVLDAKEEQVTFSTAMKKAGGASTLEMSLQTPFEPLRLLTLNSRLSVAATPGGQPDTILDISASHNGDKLFTSNVVTHISPLTSKLKLSVEAPLLPEAFNLNAGYDLTRSPEKTLELSFSQNKYKLSLKAQAVVPPTPTSEQEAGEIELRLMVESNVPSVEVSASGSIRAGYKVQADETRQIVLAIDSKQTGLWKFTAGLRPIARNFAVRLKMDTPSPAAVLPSLNCEFKLTGSGPGSVDAELFVQVGSAPPTQATLSFGAHAIRANFKSGIIGLEDLGFDGTVDRASIGRRFHFGLRSGKESAKFEGEFDGAKGSVRLTSSWDSIPNASLGVELGNNGTMVVSGMWGPRTVKIRGNLQPGSTATTTWLGSASISISVSIDAEEILAMQSRHLFNEREQSLNVTIGDNYHLETYYTTIGGGGRGGGQHAMFASRVQWSPAKQIKFVATMGQGRFNASLQSPWTSPVITHGEYRVTKHEYSARATCTIDGQQSAVEAVVLSAADAFNATLRVDIPLLGQKLAVEARILRPDDRYVEGDLDIRMKDRRLALRGSLASAVHRHADNVAMEEQTLKLSASLPFRLRGLREIQGEFQLKRPVENPWSGVQVEGTVTMGARTASTRFHYKLPSDGGASNAFTIGLVAQAPFLTSNKLEWLVDVSDVRPMTFTGDLQFGNANHVFVSWNLDDPSEFGAKMFGNLPSVLPALSPINFEAKGGIDTKIGARVRATLTWQQRSVTVQANLLGDDDDSSALSGRIFVHAPFLLPESSELSFKLQKFEHRHVVELIANHGKELVSATGELIILPNNNATASLKFSGYYGTHFIQLSSRKQSGGGGYEVELNAESMTLLKGKKMSVTGKLGAINSSKTGNGGWGALLECRTRTATHVVSATLNPSAFSIRLESPYVKTINFDGEYSTTEEEEQPPSIHIRLNANIMGKSHVLKAGYDLKHPELYLHAASPALSSQIFNIHLKAALQPHVDVLLDWNVWGHEWKLETKGVHVPGQELEAKVDVRTGFPALKRITLGLTLSPAKIYIELHTPVDELPDFVFSLDNVPIYGQGNKFDLHDFNPKLLIGLPWATYAVSGLVRLPTRAKAGELGFTVTYGDPAHAQVKEFKFGAQISAIESLSTEMEDPVQVKVTILTPYAALRNFEFAVGGRLNFRSLSDAAITMDMNGREFGVQSEVQTEEATKRLLITLRTPFKEMERSLLSVRVERYQEIGTGRNVQVDLEHSAWASPIHTELDYHYRLGENPANLEGEIMLHLPDALALPPLFLRARSGLLESGYDGLLEGHWGVWKPQLKLSVGHSATHTFGSVEVQLEGTSYQIAASFDFRQHPHEISVLVETELANQPMLIAKTEFVQTSDIISCGLLFKSPSIAQFGAQSVSAQLRISPLSSKTEVTLQRLLHSLDVSLGVELNERKLFQFELVSRNQQRSLEIHNPIQPIAFVVSYKVLNHVRMEVATEFCWNLHHPAESTVGARFNYARPRHGSDGDGIDVLLKLQAAEFGSLVLDTNNLWSAEKFEHGFKVGWASRRLRQNTTFGWYVLHDESDQQLDTPPTVDSKTRNFILRLDLPSGRSVQGERAVMTTRAGAGVSKESTTTTAQLRWDAGRDPTLRLGYSLTHDRRTSGRRTVTERSTIILLLPNTGVVRSNSPVLESERTYKGSRLHECEYIFKPNANPVNQLTIRFSRENITEQGGQLMITHPATNIDINSLVSLSEGASLFHLAYLDIRGERHVVHMEATIATGTGHGRVYQLSTGASIEQLRPLVRLEMDYKPKQQPDSEHVVRLTTQGWSFKSEIRTGLPYLSAVVGRQGADEALTLLLGLPHKRKMVAQVLRNEYGQNIQDFYIVAKFNGSNSDVVSTGLNWRPEMWHELREFVTISAPRAVRGTVREVVPAVLWRMNEEVEERLKVLDPGLDRLYLSVSRFVGQEFGDAVEEIGEWCNYFEGEYEANRFYSKYAATMATDALESAWNSSAHAIQLVQNIPLRMLKYIADTWRDLRALSALYSGNLEAVVMDAWKGVEKRIAGAWSIVVKRVKAVVAKGNGVYDTVRAAIEGNLDALQEKVWGVETMRKLACLYEDYSSWLQELPIQGQLARLRELFHEHVLAPLEVYYKPYFMIGAQIVQDGNLYALLEMPPMPYLRYIATHLADTSARLWRFVEAEQRIRDLVGAILGRVNALIQRHIPLPQFSYQVDTANGHVEFHQPLTFLEWQDFTQLPRFRVPESDEEDVSRINELYYSLLDTMRFTQPFNDLDWRHILPPFGTYALMAGDHHYLTFDRRYFRFAGDCSSYVLIADVAHQNFTLLVNYESGRKKSYSLVSGGKHLEFELDNFKVTVDGRKMELPLQFGPSTFIRRQAHGLELFDTRGFQMQCGQSPSAPVCTVSLSGWYFSKVAGLLGTYDNEPSNDFRRPDGRVVGEEDVEGFAHSWRTGAHSKGGECRQKNYAREYPEGVEDVDGICKEYLTNINSPFRPCFNEVPAQPFLEMCKYDVTANRNSLYRQEATCAAINAYVAACQRNAVDLWAPTICVKCKLEDGSSILGGENATLQEGSYIEAPKSADVIIILEETNALQNFDLNEALQKVETALKMEGFQDNKYAVVGFGGGEDPYRTPHIRTSAGQVWTSANLLKISDTGIPGRNGEISSSSSNLYEALEFASGLGFRAGVAKVMIAAIEDEESSKLVDRGYADTYTLLVENDIRFHILSPKDISLKSNKRRDDGNKIFGLDRHGVFTLWQSKRGSTTSDRSLRRFVTLPKDYYTPLAFETSGTRFNINYMRTQWNKTFLALWSRLVAGSVVQQPKCQRCECIPDKLGGAVTICQPCWSPLYREFEDNLKDLEMDMDKVMDEQGTRVEEVAPADNFDIEDSDETVEID